MSYDRPLMYWLSGHKFYLKSPMYIAGDDYDIIATYLSIDHQVPVHEASSIELRPFDPTWDETLNYIERACEILGRNIPGWAPQEKFAKKILDELGLPPLRCYAIYIITIGSGDDERCVYVGQTNARSHRFRQGHSAISALHKPQFEGLEKKLYLCGIEVEDDDDHIFPVEWTHPIERRQLVLNAVEARLIFDLQPELNTKGRTTYSSDMDLPIRTQNFVGTFLDCEFFGPDHPQLLTDED